MLHKLRIYFYTCKITTTTIRIPNLKWVINSWFYRGVKFKGDQKHLADIPSARDPRTKTGWSRTERIGPGPRTGPDQNRKKIRTPGPNRTRTEKISKPGPDQDQQNLKISDRFGPVGPRTRWSVDPCPQPELL